VEEGSEYVVLPLNFDLSKRIEGTDVLARVRVTEVGTVASVASFTQTDRTRWEKIQEGCPAVLQQLPIVKKSTVHLVTPDDKVREDFKKGWHQNNGNQNWLNLNKKGNMDAFFVVSIDESGNFEIRDQSGNFTTAIRNTPRPLPAAAADSMPALIRRLEHLARFKMIKALANPGVRPGTPSALISFMLGDAPEGIRHESGQWVPPAKIEKRDGVVYEVDEMTLFRVTIKNESRRTLGCVVLNCGAEFGIERLFPRGVPYHILHPGGTKDMDFGMEVAPELRTIAESVAFVDMLKIFVCDPARDLDSLQLQGLREMEDMIMGDGASRGSQSLGLDNLLNVGLPLYCKRKVFYYYHRNVTIKAFYTLYYSHVTY
jgi:hypothetical protein